MLVVKDGTSYAFAPPDLVPHIHDISFISDLKTIMLHHNPYLWYFEEGKPYHQSQQA